MKFVMILGSVLAVFWFDAAVAQEGYFGYDHDKWHHGFYQTLERPDTKNPCCNLTDCRPTSGRQVDGHYEVKVNGAWVSVPSGKILKRSSPCTHRGARVIGTDALDILVISQEPSDSEERNQDNEDNPNIACNLYRRLPIAVLSSGNSNSEMSAQIIPL